MINPIDTAATLADELLAKDDDPQTIAFVIANLAQYLADFTE